LAGVFDRWGITFLLAFFDETIDLEKIYRVARLAQIHDSILRFPMQYETLVGDLGSALSGGQKQRILLARALYKEPKFLFLDEASAHLDLDNERKISLALRALDMSQIIIAHREESIRMADRVIHLRDIQN
jgi:ATP-binding cassette subfamily B protein RaxB